MVDCAARSRTRIVREMIADYGEQIARERSRLDRLIVERAKRQYAAEALATEGQDAEARRFHLEAHHLQHQIDASEDRIDRMEELLAVFRRKLLEVQRAA